MATCASKLGCQIACMKHVIADYHYEYWLLKNVLLNIGENEGLTDEEWDIVERHLVPVELPRGHFRNPEHLNYKRINGKDVGTKL